MEEKKLRKSYGRRAKRAHALPGTSNHSRKPNSTFLKNHIREIRRQKYMTQAELSEMVGVTTATLSNWESMKLSPTDENKIALCKALRVKITELFDWEV